jgi:hypothetical protein
VTVRALARRRHGQLQKRSLLGQRLAGESRVPIFSLNHPSAYRGRSQASIRMLFESRGAEPLQVARRA